MINHFRSLLLNESASTLPGADYIAFWPTYDAYTSHIDPSYCKVALPADFGEVYGLLFPNRTASSASTLSIDYLVPKLHLTHLYMMMLKAAGLDAAATALDSRITYDLTSDDAFFQTRAYSVGVPKTTLPAEAWLRVFDFTLTPDEFKKQLGPNIMIGQVDGSPSKVKVYTEVDGEEIWLPATSVVFPGAGDVSSPITVYNPSSPSKMAFKFVIKCHDFAAQEHLLWQVNWTTPVAISASSIVDRVTSPSNRAKIDRVLAKYQATPDAVNYDRLWKEHFNVNYRLAGLVTSLVYRINQLWLS